MVSEQQKKRHHYVPVAYLKEFADSSGRIFAYRKDDPDAELHLKPDEVAFERYYYSQPLPDNQQDNNKIEDFFNTVETPWPGTVACFKSSEPSTKSNLMVFFQFIALMRVRVPAARDMAEAHLAESVKAFAKRLDRQGKFPPKPEGFENLMDNVEVSIDPHKSIHAMVDLAKGFSTIVDRLGFSVIHNRTGLAFITSDNPVAYYDPDVPETAMRPYDINPNGGRIELLFPISPDMLILGRTEWKYQFSTSGIRYYDLSDKREVKRINRNVARFGYRFLFSNRTVHNAFIRKHAGTSPILKTTVVPTEKGEMLLFQSVFGQRKRKPKWVRPENQTFESS